MSDSLLRVERNDVDAVLKIRKRELATGEWDQASSEMAIMLQDDPDELLDAFVEQDKQLKKLKKALPRMSAEEKADKVKPKGSKPIKASTKTLGDGGRVRYDYAGEKGGEKKPQTPAGMKTGGQYDKPTKGNDKEEEEELPEEREAYGADEPRTDIPPPEPDQDPIQVPSAKQQMDGAKHTVNIAELLHALAISREQLNATVQRFVTKLGGRGAFQTFMEKHAKDFAEEHGLDRDYFGLVYDVITGVVPEGQQQPAQQPPQQEK